MRMEMIIDFIKSWFYYPKMKKYLKDRCCIYYSQSRLNYALWHCKFSKKIEKAKTKYRQQRYFRVDLSISARTNNKKIK